MAREHVLGDLFRPFRRVSIRVATHERREEEVFLSPHHALRHTCGAAGVEDVEVVPRAFREVALRRRGLERLLVVRRAGGRAVGFAAVLDDEEGAEAGQLGGDCADARREFSVMDQAYEVCVVKEVAQLLLDVAVVDINRHRPRLERSEGAFQILSAVVEIESNVVALPHAVCGQPMSELS